MRPYSCLLGALLTFSLPACHKAEDGPTTAKGRVVDSVTGQGVGGARVRLLQTARSGNILSGGGSQALDTVVADAQGAYAFSFSASEDYQYELQGFAPGYLKGAFDSQPTVAITGGRKNRKTVPIRPEGYLRVRLLAPSPAPRAGVQLENYNGSYAYVFAGLDGRPVVPIDTSLIITYPGGQPNTFAWRVYLDSFGTSTAHSQTQFFPARDTADFTITF